MTDHNGQLLGLALLVQFPPNIVSPMSERLPSQNGGRADTLLPTDFCDLVQKSLVSCQPLLVPY